MKYKLVNEPITENYAQNLLTARGVSDFYNFVNPTVNNLINPKKLINIEKGATLLLNILEKNGQITIIVDCDVDGFTSSTILWKYIKTLYPNANLSYKIHSGKQHGLEDMIDKIEEEHCADLVILPDAGSNDYDYHKRLKEIGIPILVLDHHDAELESKDAIIINNRLSEEYDNKDLTGAGVVWQFCRYLDKKFGTIYANQYIDLAALGLISDMANVLTLENRYIIKTGLEHIRNYFFQVLVNKQSFSLGDQVTPIGVAFYITPLINAAIRVGTSEEKEKLFLAFLDGHQILSSTKRGEKGGTEDLATQVARECTNARNKQNRIKEKAVEILETKIAKKDLLSNKILFIKLDDDDDFPAVLNGSTLLAR